MHHSTVPLALREVRDQIRAAVCARQHLKPAEATPFLASHAGDLDGLEPLEQLELFWARLCRALMRRGREELYGVENRPVRSESMAEMQANGKTSFGKSTLASVIDDRLWFFLTPDAAYHIEARYAPALKQF